MAQQMQADAMIEAVQKTHTLRQLQYRCIMIAHTANIK